jgi:hypothetical protein
MKPFAKSLRVTWITVCLTLAGLAASTAVSSTQERASHACEALTIYRSTASEHYVSQDYHYGYWFP